MDRASRRKIEERDHARYEADCKRQAQFERAQTALQQGATYRSAADLSGLSKSTIGRLAKALGLDQRNPTLRSVANALALGDSVEQIAESFAISTEDVARIAMESKPVDGATAIDRRTTCGVAAEHSSWGQRSWFGHQSRFDVPAV